MIKSKKTQFKENCIPWNKNISHSKETKKKISDAKKGKKLSEEHKKELSKILKKDYKSGKRKKTYGFKGKYHSSEHKEKMSKIMKGRKRLNLSRENNGMWKGGITSKKYKIRKSIEYKIWYRKIFKRDNYICQKCNKSGGYLEAHHIYNFSEYIEFRFDIDNGITFCKKCHKKFHKMYGYKNNKIEQVYEFLQLMLKGKSKRVGKMESISELLE